MAPYGYVTLLLAELDPRTHRFEYVTAGHPPPVLFRPGVAAERLSSTGGPIAMPIPVPLSSASIELVPGSLLAIWSDGIPEAVRLGGRPVQDFTEQRLVARLRELRQEPLDAILAGIFQESEDTLEEMKTAAVTRMHSVCASPFWAQHPPDGIQGARHAPPSKAAM